MLTLLLAAMLAAGPDVAGNQRELGKDLFKQGKVDQAIERFRAAVKLNPQDAVAWYNLAYASRKARKYDQAAEAYQKYTALSPDDPDGYFGLAESLRSAGRAAEAMSAYTAYISKEKRPSEQRWVDEAKLRIAEIQAPPPPRPDPPPAKPDPQPPAAAAQAAPAAAPRPVPSPGPYLRRGDAAFAARDWRTALFAYQDAILTAPANVEALTKAGLSYAKLGHDEEAIVQFEKALRLEPQNAAVREALAAARERRAALAPQAVPARADDSAARAQYTRAVGLLRDKKYDEAAAELDRALALKPDFAVALVARGSARIGQGRYQDAVGDYTAAQKADPSLAAPLFGLAEAWRALGQGQKAAELYRRFAASSAPDAEPALKEYAAQNAQALAPQ